MKVSVIIPLFNKEKELPRCLNSLLNQTLKDIEIIVINDGSTDNSLKILKEFAKKSSNIRIISKENGGIGKARNVGLTIAKGDYIGYVDSDDYVEETMYEKLYNFAIMNNLDMVNSNYNKIVNGEKTRIKNIPFEICNKKLNENIINLIDYGPCNKLFKKDFLTNNKVMFEENMKYEDFPFIALAINEASSIGFLDEYLYDYCINDNSETTTMDKLIFDILDIMRKVNLIYKYKTVELEFLNINKIIDYMAQQKNQKDKFIRNKFIQEGYEFLKNNFPNWKKNKLYKKRSITKRLIGNNIILLKIYCSLSK